MWEKGERVVMLAPPSLSENHANLYKEPLENSCHSEPRRMVRSKLHPVKGRISIRFLLFS